ncbi:MAG TPA: hypothetical protein DCE44_13635, partial [Verrucomicrobiales bacterium]|nr:hypothetical protein [Verrucomicrobiales bacterium]
RWPEAIRLRQEQVALCRRVFGLEHPSTINATTRLATCYSAAGRGDEAETLFQEQLAISNKALGPADDESRLAAEGLANIYFADGRQQEAIAMLAKASEPASSDSVGTFASLTLATWQAWSGTEADYEATRCRLLREAEQNKGTDPVNTAHRAAKAYCLRPSNDPARLARALDLARQGVGAGKTDWTLPCFHEGLGMAEYRNGQYAAAEQTLLVTEQLAQKLLSGRFRLEIQETARLFRAMSLFKQGRLEEARKLWRQVEAQMPPFPDDVSKPLDRGQPTRCDRLICWLVYKEAKALLNDAAFVKP